MATDDLEQRELDEFDAGLRLAQREMDRDGRSRKTIIQPEDSLEQLELTGLDELERLVTAASSGGGLLSQGIGAAVSLLNRHAYWRPPARTDGAQARRGRPSQHPGGTLEVLVVVHDLRSHFGTLDFLVRPVQGRGDGRWVRGDSLTFIETPENPRPAAFLDDGGLDA